MAYIRKITKPKNCAVCGKEFTPIATIQKYCGPKCASTMYYKGNSTRKQKERVCKNCGKTFLDWGTRPHMYCNKKCYTEYRQVRSRCRICHILFIQPKSRKRKVFTCSTECAAQYKAIKPIKKTSVDTNWAKAVKLRAGNKCEYCGETKALNSHHIFSRSKLSTRWNLDNGVCLCAKHHVFSFEFSAHKNPVEFIEWLKEKRGQEWYDSLRQRAVLVEKPDRKKENEKLLEELRKFP